MVTSFEFRLHPLDPMMLAGLVAWPMDDAPKALDTVAPKSYVAHQKLLDLALPHGLHYYWKPPQAGRSPTRRLA